MPSSFEAKKFHLRRLRLRRKVNEEEKRNHNIYMEMTFLWTLTSFRIGLSSCPSAVSKVGELTATGTGSMLWQRVLSVKTPFFNIYLLFHVSLRLNETSFCLLCTNNSSLHPWKFIIVSVVKTFFTTLQRAWNLIFIISSPVKTAANALIVWKGPRNVIGKFIACFTSFSLQELTLKLGWWMGDKGTEVD